MRKLVISTLVAAAWTIAAPAAASTEAQGAEVAGSAAKADKKICRWIDTTGSKRTERVCLTAKQWKQVERELEKF